MKFHIENIACGDCICLPRLVALRYWLFMEVAAK